MSDLQRRIADLSPQQRAQLEALARQRKQQRGAPPAAGAPRAPGSALVCPQPRPEARARVVLVPHAGGGAAVYRQWHARFPTFLESCAIRLPGREGRMAEPPARRLVPMAHEIAAELNSWLGELPFAMFGHSMGALLTFEIVRELVQRYGKVPQHLFLASYRAPQTQRPSAVRRHHSEGDMVGQFMGDNDVSRPMAEELIAMLRPIVEADVEMCETYDYAAAPPLPCPLSVSRGARDYVTDEDLAAWAEQTRAAFSVRTFAGDHFFLHHHVGTLIQDLSAALSWCSAASPSSKEIQL
jgi:medium-chain acyl-[acyl-carrier-protein] hydrolase